MADLSSAISLSQQLVGVLQSTGAGGSDADGARREALRLTKLLTSTLEDPGEVAFEMCLLPSYSLACRVGGKLNLFAALTASPGSKTVTDLAAATKAEPLLLVRILRVLAAQGVVREVGRDEYEAVAVTHVMAAPPMLAIHRHVWDQSVNCMAKLPEWLDQNGLRCPDDPTAGVFQHTFNTKLEAFEYWQGKPEVFDTVNTVMEGMRSSRPDWVDWYPVQEQILDAFEDDGSGSPLIVDVGGGRGHQLVSFLKRFPQPKGRLVLEDLRPVIEDVKALPDEIVRQSYDFFTPQPVHGARIYFFGHIFHDWSDESCLKILRNTASAMKKGYSKLMIHDMIMPDTGCSATQAAFDMNMMAVHAGMERSRSQWTELLTKAGFQNIRFSTPPGDSEGIVEAEP